MSALLGIIAAPFLPGVINRVKAVMAGRKGQPLLQAYYDLGKLLRKGAVYSRSTTWIFRVAPPVGLAATLIALCLLPFGGRPGLLAFSGDLILLAGLFAFARFLTILAALDTASSFEGMGASREAAFSALAEPALLLGLAVVARVGGDFSLTGMLGGMSYGTWTRVPAPLALASATLFIVLLAENSRIPFDDPNTHLELTMVHEVMVLDHGGPDLAMIQYSAALKLYALGVLLADILIPVQSADAWWGPAASFGGVAALMAAVGLVESCMARLRLIVVPRLLLGAAASSLVAFLLAVRP